MCPKYRSDTQEIEIGLAGDIDLAAQFSIFDRKNANILHVYAVIRLGKPLFYTFRKQRLLAYNLFLWLFAVIFLFFQSLRHFAETNALFMRRISIPPPSCPKRERSESKMSSTFIWKQKKKSERALKINPYPAFWHSTCSCYLCWNENKTRERRRTDDQ